MRRRRARVASAEGTRVTGRASDVLLQHALLRLLWLLCGRRAAAARLALAYAQRLHM